MHKINKLLGLLGVLLFSTGVYAADIQVEGAWAAASAPGQEVGKADLTIISKGGATLSGVSSPVCKSVELHSMSNANGMMKMREVQGIALPAGKRVNLGESGYHLMLMGLRAPLKAGDSVPLKLNIRLADKSSIKINVMAVVKSLAGMEPASHDDMHEPHRMY
ncbi:MAG TPA: copper chaperone PCu(A)C [Gallionella sp.]|nr:copper chaperone PCu(A)C [Gallionella sp.]